jgi:hypothetical protein
MSFDDSRTLPYPEFCNSRRRRALIVTSYMTGAPQGRNVGKPGYSYDLVVRLFAPLLAEWGELTVVSRDELDAAVGDARRRNLDPVHVSFLPFQDVHLAEGAPNVVVPAWEYPNVPDHEFDFNPRNNWVAMAARCDLVIVGGPFTAAAFGRAGVKTPIRIVPVPTPESYFEMPLWNPERPVTLHFPANNFSHPTRAEHERTTANPVAPDSDPPAAQGRRPAAFLRTVARQTYRHCVKPLLSQRLSRTIRASAVAAIDTWRQTGRYSPVRLPKQPRVPLDLSGVVYTSIFNPIDGRKNWQDLLTGFLCALKDCDDATLVMKLITNDPGLVYDVWHYYQCLGIPHCCRVAMISDFLSDEQLVELVGPTTYYLTTTRAEGNCLPLMNYLAAGRPAISPRHTAIADYFDRDVGFVVESHPEPTAFPHDSRFRRTTTWHRLVWPSLAEQIRKSYEIAKWDRSTYRRLAQNARQKMLAWSHPREVGPRLHQALNLVVPAQREELPAETIVPRLKAA